MLRRLASWLRPVYDPRSKDRDIDEARFHLELETEDRQTSGVSAVQARLAARRDFGNLGLIKESTRGVWVSASLGRLLQDSRYAFRTLRRSPGFFAAAVCSLALGIGANTAIFSLFDMVLLKMLPVKNPEELVIFAHRGSGESSTSSNYPIYETLRIKSRTFSGVLALWSIGFRVRVAEYPERAEGQYITSNYFKVLGVTPLLGRSLEESDFEQPVAVISYGFWQRTFGGAPDVVGRSFHVNGQPVSVIGVAPPQFFGIARGWNIDFWLPFGAQRQLSPEFGDRLTMRDSSWGLCIVGRLMPATRVETARAEVEVLMDPWIQEVVLPETGGSLAVGPVSSFCRPVTDWITCAAGSRDRCRC